MSASTRSKGEQYGGYLKVRTEEEGDNAQGQDEVTMLLRGVQAKSSRAHGKGMKEYFTKTQYLRSQKTM